MPTTSIACGILLILTGIIGYGYGLTGERASFTALIPAVLGLLLLILGFLAKSKENLRKHLMHVAVIVGLLGFMMGAGRLVMNISRLALTAPTISTLAMTLICLVFV